MIYSGYNLIKEDIVYRYETVTVYSGDNMWSIAEDLTGKNEDVREVISRIVEFNKLKTKHIASGQVLIVPVRVEYKEQLMLAEVSPEMNYK